MKIRLSLKSLIAATILLLHANVAAAASALPSVVNYWELILEHAGLHGEDAALWEPTLGALFGLVLLTVIGLLFRRSVMKDGDDVTPKSRFSLRTLVEMLLDIVYNLAKDNIPHGYGRFMTLLAGIFFSIFFVSLAGLVPGFVPPTESMNNNLAMGLVVFIVYNYAGFKEHGAKYLKQFAGPVVAIAPLYFVIELLSHSVRPFSLSLRLVLNIFSDHLVNAVFINLTWLLVPAVLAFFGLLVVVVQSYIFTLLTSVYISMAMSHDH